MHTCGPAPARFTSFNVCERKKISNAANGRLIATGRKIILKNMK